MAMRPHSDGFTIALDPNTVAPYHIVIAAQQQMHLGTSAAQQATVVASQRAHTNHTDLHEVTLQKMESQKKAPLAGRP